MSEINQNIINEYIQFYREYIDEVKGKNYKKLSGNIFAMIIKNHIEKILKDNNLKYKVSNNNAFIKGCPIEWDLIILKEDALDKGLNIFESDDVVSVIELKSGGQPLGKDKITCLKDIYDDKFKQIDKIRFIYISYFDMTNSYNCLKEYFKEKNDNKNSVFTFYSGNSYSTREYISECSNFEEFICNIVKDTI